VVGTMMGLGASISPTFAGYMSDTFGSPAAFMGLAVIAMFALATVWFLMPETRPDSSDLRTRPSDAGCRSSSSPASPS
jgi:predicted MFS family arabinose efflux permease